jgi:hypothetical protein
MAHFNIECIFVGFIGSIFVVLTSDPNRAD